MSQNVYVFYLLRVESKDGKENPPPTQPSAPDLPSRTNPDPTGSPSPNTMGLSTSGLPPSDPDPVIHSNLHSARPSILVTAVPSGPLESGLSPQTNSNTMGPPLSDPSVPRTSHSIKPASSDSTEPSTPGLPPPDPDAVVLPDSHSTRSLILAAPVTSEPAGPHSLNPNLTGLPNPTTMEPLLLDPSVPWSPHLVKPSGSDSTELSTSGLPAPSADPDTMVLPNSPLMRSPILATPVPVNSGSTSKLVEDCLRDLKDEPWKVQKKVVKTLFVLSQTGGCRSAMQLGRLMVCIAVGEKVICSKVNEIVGMLLREPEDYWNAQDMSSSSLGEIRPSRMLGPAAALYTLSASRTFRFAAWPYAIHLYLESLRTQIRECEQYAALKGRFFSGSLFNGKDTSLWKINAPNQSRLCFIPLETNVLFYYLTVQQTTFWSW